ncbi:glutathione S-transferase family protein [Microvirga massiliensis]|uniref:glutathione S-transferase family protein n=1 Tax=Microvirga massiliensis TaxID=1033741 RepID=UPI00062B60C3|nr:glutathione S-transferase family protein [Microvirga massiliensis]
MMDEYVLYGVPGWGSVLAEAMLTWCGASFRIEDVEGFDKPGRARDRLLAINPIAQVPTLILPDGTVMTESAAIALHLAETYPDAELAPPPGSPERPAYLRRLVWLVANVYPTFTYGDYPERWTLADAEGLRTATHEYRKRLWRELETDIGGGPWALGERFSALDIYVGAMSRWRPGRAWFEDNCSKLTGIARRADELPKLIPVWKRNFPEPGGSSA